MIMTMATIITSVLMLCGLDILESDDEDGGIGVFVVDSPGMDRLLVVVVGDTTETIVVFETEEVVFGLVL